MSQASRTDQILRPENDGFEEATLTRAGDFGSISWHCASQLRESEIDVSSPIRTLHSDITGELPRYLILVLSSRYRLTNDFASERMRPRRNDGAAKMGSEQEFVRRAD